MPDILIRGVDAQVVRRLKSQAKRNGRSFQDEARTILEESARDPTPDEMQANFNKLWKELVGSKCSGENR